MKKKALLVLALLAIIGTSAVFSQRVGDIVQLSGQPYVVESVSGDRVVLQRASLNGVWLRDNGEQITINGSAGVYNNFGSSNVQTQDAINKGYVKLGDQRLRNLRSTDNFSWSGQILGFTFNTNSPNVATGTRWQNCTITISADGRTITLSATTDTGRTDSFTYTRR